MKYLKQKDILIVIISIVVIIALILFINPTKFIEQIKSISMTVLIILIGLFIIDLFLRVCRWYVLLLSQDHNIPIKALIYPSLSSSFLNLVLPGRLGEVVRLYALKDQYNVSYSAGLSVIVVEMVINAMSLIIVSSFALGVILFSGIQLKYDVLNSLLPYAFIGSLILIVGILLLFIVDPNKFVPLFSFLPENLHAKVIRLIHTFAFGLQTIKQKFYIFYLAAGMSMVIWFLEGIMIWLFTIQSGFIDPNYEFPVALFASTIGNLNFLLPVLPGAALQYEIFLATVLSLSQYYTGSSAISVGFADRVLKTLILAILGGFSLTKLGSDTLSVIRKKTDTAAKIEQARNEFAD